MGLKEILILQDKIFFGLLNKEISIIEKAALIFKNEYLNNLQDSEKYSKEIKNLER